MKAKNLLWVALLGVAMSCTVSKRIDKWGYRLSLDKKSHNVEAQNVETPASENVASVNEDKKSINLLVSSTDAVTIQNESTVENNLSMVTPENVTVVSKSENSAKIKEAKPSAQEIKASKLIAKQLNKFESRVQTGFQPSKGVLVLLAIFIPLLAVYLYEGSWTKRCTVNLLLCLLCGLPGVIHALVVVLG
jgi:uncharacterized membrane protein YqaE (UPF0057 family)